MIQIKEGVPVEFGTPSIFVANVFGIRQYQYVMKIWSPNHEMTIRLIVSLNNCRIGALIAEAAGEFAEAFDATIAEEGPPTAYIF